MHLKLFHIHKLEMQRFANIFIKNTKDILLTKTIMNLKFFLFKYF